MGKTKREGRETEKEGEEGKRKETRELKRSVPMFLRALSTRSSHQIPKAKPLYFSNTRADALNKTCAARPALSRRKGGRVVSPRRGLKQITLNALGDMTESIDVYVKGHASGNLGDCPFSHRVLLMLEEKKVSYKPHYIDLKAKPDWFLAKNPSGTVPVLNVDEDIWISDSDTICEFLENSRREPCLIPENDSTCTLGQSFFGSFAKYVKNKSKLDEKHLKHALEDEIKMLDEALKGKVFLDGPKLCSVDLGLYPKIRHMIVAAGHFKGFAVPAECSNFLKYVELMESQQSVKNVFYPDSYIIEGWASKAGPKL